MKLYRITAQGRGTHRFFQAGKPEFLGLNRYARTSKVDAVRKYNALKKEAEGLPIRIRLEFVQVPDRLTVEQWAQYLETETIDIEVIEVLRDETFEVAA